MQQEDGYMRNVIKIQGPMRRVKILRMKYYNRNRLELKHIIPNVNRSLCNWRDENTYNHLLF